MPARSTSPTCSPASRQAVSSGDRSALTTATPRGPAAVSMRRARKWPGSVGVAVVKVALSPLETAWREAGEQVGLVDRAGMIFLSDVKEWKYFPLYPLT